MSASVEAQDRQAIVGRAIDLANNDPHAAGVVDTFATTIAGSGLVPIPIIDPEITGISKDDARDLQIKERAVYQRWYPFADAGNRMSFGGIQYQIMRTLIEYGEFLILLPMITDDPLRPYNLACQVINPQRLKTPVDKINTGSIKDGVELGPYGQPVAYWIKKSLPSGMGAALPDTSLNFLRIPAKVGHRWNVIHGFISKDPEQVRGWSFFAPAMKFFRDFNDFLDAELMANLITSSFTMFIETGINNDPLNIARNVSSFIETRSASDGTARQARYQEVEPGTIMYGNTGEKPWPITANRPGVTFDPFTKIIKKALAMSMNIPYPVLFKDVEGVNYAGFRSAMLDAWRVFTFYREWLGRDILQKPYTMLMEEAYLRGELSVSSFYLDMNALTKADWRGSPKGDIEPIKSAQADILLIEKNLKTRSASIAERGGDLKGTFDQLQEEQEMMRERGLTEESITASPESAGSPDDMENAGAETATSGAHSDDNRFAALARQIHALTEKQETAASLLEEIRDNLP
jgi:lambda family phage portal protein